MTCPICKHGELKPGLVTVTLDRGTSTIVFRGVPARVCQNCGEQFVDEAVTSRLLQEAEQAARSGVEVEVRRFNAA
ncbi:MAG: type II toxin-antitoxin system MqsA family antitoxin [Phycisphaeraceae bacterium]|nr:type II toxin-antitoxin system MqsA family antitoxin [Phycisphaeraceae bacterium]